ncbi:MAG TPA: hypothetical protein VGD45_08855 [Steroidobacter sp.]|uniref:hypothetical protein n=1 Tax=Steroidobacter sp. TaxID=1978227 RepID=UPI002EDB573C
MLMTVLGKLRPLFVVALVLCWNAVGLALSDRAGALSSASLVLLACAALTLGILCASVSRAAWARDLVLRPETEYHEVRGGMFLFGSLSFFLAAWTFLKAWELTHPV